MPLTCRPPHPLQSVYLDNQDQERNFLGPHLNALWQFSYWAAFSLCWIVFPFLSDYVDAGEFTVAGRIKRSIINNLIFYGIALVIAMFPLAYLWFKGQFEGYGYDSSSHLACRVSFKGFLMALGNAWGLFLIILFLGYGIVQVPRRFWSMRDLNYRQK